MTSKNGKTNNVQQGYEFPKAKEPVSWTRAIFDKDEGTFFGRTAKNWGQLGIFYLIFYIVLASMFAICMQGLLATLNDQEPKWKLHDSLIGTNPGLGFRPISEETERGGVIHFDRNKTDEGKYWKGLLDEFIKEYKVSGEPGRKEKLCSFDQKHNPQDICSVNITQFGPCSSENNYGYLDGKPCIFLKLNKIYNWEPEFYSDPEDLPDDMPKDLKEHIASLKPNERSQIWVSCQGLHALDRESVHSISYYPSRGFPSFYYPFRNQKNYLSPLIAVQLEHIDANKMLNIECRAWARNIIFVGSMRDRQGSVAFQIILD